MRRSILILSAIAAAQPLALTPAAAADRFNRGVASVHQPVVQRSDYVIDVPATFLDGAQLHRISGWFDAIELGYGDRVSLDLSAAGSTVANGQIAEVVGDYGLLLSEGAPVTDGAIAPGSVRIVVSRSTASVPGCPDYSIASQPNFTSSASSNYGCAINSTMAAMIADPDDLVRGQRARGGNTTSATKAIKSWREAKPSAENGLKIESSKAN